MSNDNETMLLKVSAADNNNKFYHVILSPDGAVSKRYGRVGVKGVTTVEHTGRHGYEKIIREKMRKGYKKIDVVAAENVSTQTGANADLAAVAKSVLANEKFKGNAVLDSLIERLVAINRHEILEASGGLIKVDTNGIITTPLGLISLKSIENAEGVLKRIKSAGTTISPDALSTLLEEYLTLVPQKIEAKRGWQDHFFNQENTIQSQLDFLQQLKDSLAWQDAQVKAHVAAETKDTVIDAMEEKYKSLFKFQVGVVDPESKEFKDIDRLFQSTKNSRHSASRLRLKRVFALIDPVGDEKYNSILADIGNKRQLWHGTRAFNVLSILRKGLYCPPVSGTSIPTTGRMFGDGIYLANSSKSLNYSLGVWSGARESNCFMFLADVAMGNEFRPRATFDRTKLDRAHNGLNKYGKPFHSISIKGGTCGVLNDEIIVWNTDAVRLRYLCEFDN